MTDIDDLIDEAWVGMRPKGGTMTWDEIKAAHDRHDLEYPTFGDREIVYDAGAVAVTIVKLESRIKFLEAEVGRLASLVSIHFPGSTMPPVEDTSMFKG